MEGIRKRIDFLKTAIRDPQVGGITMSSRYVIEHVVKRLPKKLDTVIECGPGEGVLTKRLLKHLSFSGKLITIEPNRSFVERLRTINDRRLEVVKGTVQSVLPDLAGRLGAVDLVIASIPFSFLARDERLKIVGEVYDILKPGGTFIIFNQYRQVMHAPVKKIFDKVSVSFEVRNILPCFIIDAQKTQYLKNL